MNVYPFIEAEKQEQRNVKRACELLQVSRAAHYATRAGHRSRHAQDNAELTEAIQQAHVESKGRYGAPRIHAELPPAPQDAGRSSTTSAGSTAPGCTAPSATAHPTSSKRLPERPRWRR